MARKYHPGFEKDANSGFRILVFEPEEGMDEGKILVLVRNRTKLSEKTGV